jgi:hypothetical protein
MEAWLILEIKLQKCLSVINRDIHCFCFQNFYITSYTALRSTVRRGYTNFVLVLYHARLNKKVIWKEIWAATRMVHLIVVGA